MFKKRIRALRPFRIVMDILLTQTNARVLRSCTAIAALLIPACASTPAGGGPETVVLVVRHGERTSQDANADLSAVGLARARALAGIALEHGVSAVYSTDFCRTAQTGLPAARQAGTGLGVLASGSSAAGLTGCNPSIDVPLTPAGDMAPASVASRILERHRGEVVMVVGHSNTVPELVGALAGGSACPRWVDLLEGRCILPESAYGDLFVIHLPAGGAARVERRHFDPAS